MNIRNILNRSIIELKQAGIPTPEIDSRVLLEHALEKDSIFLITNPSRPLTNLEYGKFRRYIRKRKNNIPVAYIAGHKEFFGYDFLVNKHTLIPRPESEFLVEYSLKHINSVLSSQHSDLNVLDLGTGSGCIIISLALEISKLSALNSRLNLFASDISKNALNMAKKNAKNLLTPLLSKEGLGVVKVIKFYHSDLFSNKLMHKKYDVIIANLPYVPEEAKSEKRKAKTIESISYEPQNAIFADDNGTAIIKKFLSQSKNRLAKDGIILIELDYRNAKDLMKYARNIYSKAEIVLKKDLAGLDRYIVISAIVI